MRFQRNRQRQVGHGPGGVDGHFVRILLNHAHHESRGIFCRRFSRWRAFRHWRDVVRPVHRVPPREIPRTLVHNFSIKRFPLRNIFFAVHQRKSGARHHRNIGAANNFKQAQGVLHFFIAPRITGQNRDSQNIRVRRIYQRQYGLHIRTARPGAILINDHFAFSLRIRSGIQTQCDHHQHDPTRNPLRALHEIFLSTQAAWIPQQLNT